MKDTLIFTQNRYNLIIVRLTQGKTCCAVQGGYLNKWPNNVILPEGGEIERGREKESKRERWRGRGRERERERERESESESEREKEREE